MQEWLRKSRLSLWSRHSCPAGAWPGLCSGKGYGSPSKTRSKTRERRWSGGRNGKTVIVQEWCSRVLHMESLLTISDYNGYRREGFLRWNKRIGTGKAGDAAAFSTHISSPCWHGYIKWDRTLHVRAGSLPVKYINICYKKVRVMTPWSEGAAVRTPGECLCWLCMREESTFPSAGGAGLCIS